jgi:hypothetical protein
MFQVRIATKCIQEGNKPIGRVKWKQLISIIIITCRKGKSSSVLSFPGRFNQCRPSVLLPNHQFQLRKFSWVASRIGVFAKTRNKPQFLLSKGSSFVASRCEFFYECGSSVYKSATIKSNTRFGSVGYYRAELLIRGE